MPRQTPAGGLFGNGRLFHHGQDDGSEPGEAERMCCRWRDVDHPATHEGPAIIDPNHDGVTIAATGDAYLGAEWK